MNQFVSTSKDFGRKIDIQNSNALHQPAPGWGLVAPRIPVDGLPLRVTQSFTYLGSIISHNGQLDSEIESRISKAPSPFAGLNQESGAAMT